MPAVKTFTTSVLFSMVTLSILLSCTSKKQTEKDTLHQSEMSYMGPAARNIILKLGTKNSNPTEIIAQFKVPHSVVGTLSYKWKLDEGLTLVQGEQTGTIEYSIPNKVVSLFIKIDGFTSEKVKFVRFEVSGLNENKPIFADGIVSSQKEQSFEALVQEVEKIHAQ